MNGIDHNWFVMLICVMTSFLAKFILTMQKKALTMRKQSKRPLKSISNSWKSSTSLAKTLLTISFLSGAMHKSEFGSYNYYFSIYSLYLIPFTVGFSRFNVRFLASIGNNFRSSRAGGIFKAEVKILAVMTLFSLCVAFLLLPFITFSKLLVIFLIIIPFVAVKNIITSLLRGMGYTFYGNFDGLLMSPLLFLAALYVSYEFLNIELLASYNALIFLALYFLFFNLSFKILISHVVTIHRSTYFLGK